MKIKRSLALLIFTMLFLLLPLSTSGKDEPEKRADAGGSGSIKKEDLGQTITPKDMSGVTPKASSSRDVFNGDLCIETKKDEDTYLVTRVGGTSSCMLISLDEDIPKTERGTRTYGEHCDGKTKCKLYVRLNETCLKPTHLRCDLGSNKCVCSADGLFLPAIRFQFGTDEDAGQNLTHGRCLTRPTFDVVPHVDCSPGTNAHHVAMDEDEDPLSICACDQQDENFDSINTNWWRCSKGSILSMGKQLVPLACMVQFVIGIN